MHLLILVDRRFTDVLKWTKLYLHDILIPLLFLFCMNCLFLHFVHWKILWFIFYKFFFNDPTYLKNKWIKSGIIYSQCFFHSLLFKTLRSQRCRSQRCRRSVNWFNMRPNRRNWKVFNDPQKVLHWYHFFFIACDHQTIFLFFFF